MSTAIITSDTSIHHLTGDGHPERPERVIATKEFTKGRVISILEGGYDLAALADSSNEHVNALLEFN